MREFYFNGDFDVTLRGAPSLLETGDPTFLHEMANHFLFAAESGDRVIVHEPLPREFLEYLADLGLEPPGVRVHPQYSPEAEFTPFGWNAHAEALNLRYAAPARHPDLDAVRRANSRAFSHAFESALEHGLREGGLFESLAALEDYLRDHPRPEGWVAKANHGHAGTGNQRIAGATPDPSERHDLEIIFRENGVVALEPWQDRLMDMAVNFRVGSDGSLHDFRGHETVNSRLGAFLGVKISPTGQPPEPWRPALERTAASLGKALHRIGYHGPVGLDAYVHSEPLGPMLRPCVDINARQSMALPAHGLARRLPDRLLLWIWAKPKKLLLPPDYRDLALRLGTDAFDPAIRRGILVASPLRLGERKPKRVSLVLCARDEEDLVRLQSRYQAALRRY